MHRSFESLTHLHSNLGFTELADTIVLCHIDETVRVDLKIELDEHSYYMVLKIYNIQHFKELISHGLGGTKRTYHALCGGVYTGFREVYEIDLTPETHATRQRHFLATFEFPRNVSWVRWLMNAIVPDLNRVTPLTPYSFALIARNYKNEFTTEIKLKKRCKGTNFDTD